jgi:hypothetical protein
LRISSALIIDKFHGLVCKNPSPREDSLAEAEEIELELGPKEAEEGLLQAEWGSRRAKPCSKISSGLIQRAIWGETIWTEETRSCCLPRPWRNWVDERISAAQGNMPQPLVFRINSMRTKKIVYCGVLEFVAPDDTCILPNWVSSLHQDFHGHAADGRGIGEHLLGTLYSNCNIPEDQASSNCLHQSARPQSLVTPTKTASRLSSETSSV